MRLSRYLVFISILGIICIITTGNAVNSALFRGPGSLTSELTTAEQSLEGLDVTVRSTNTNFHWGHEQVVSEPVPGMNSNTGGSNRPAIAVENGKIYLVWQDSNDTNGAGTDSDIFFRYYDGVQWSEIFVVSEPTVGVDTSVGVSEDPDVAVENGEVHVVWVEWTNLLGAGGDPDIFYRHFNGSSWAGLEAVSEPTAGTDTNTGTSYYPAVAVESGRVHVVWDDPTFMNGAGTDPDIFYRVRDGSSWSNTEIISEPIPGADTNTKSSKCPRIAVNDSKIHIVWSDGNDTNGAGIDTDIFYRNYNGNFWANIEVISDPIPGNNINTRSSEWPDIAVEQEEIYIVWEDASDTNGAGEWEWDIFYRYFDSSTWHNIEVLSEPIPGQDTNIELSNDVKIAVESGCVHVVWEDLNVTDNSGTDEDIFYKYYDGKSWTKVIVLSEPVPGANINSLESGKPAITVEHRKVHLVWWDKNDTDNSGLDADILYRCTYVPPTLTAGLVSPASGFVNTYFNYFINYSDADNEPPSYIKININGTNHTMQELNASDNYYCDGNIYFYNTTLNISTAHRYQFWTSDGTYKFNTGLFNGPEVMNAVPTITTEDNLTVFEDYHYEVQYNFTDIEPWQAHDWNFYSNASLWLNFDLSTGILNGTPGNEHVGSYWVNISITDDLACHDFTNFSLTVIGINDAPEILTVDITSAYEDELYEVDYEVVDVDDPVDILNWSSNTDANWLAFNTTAAILNGTPTNDDIGEFWVNITVNDTNTIDYTNFTLVVINTNDPPEIITVPKPTATIGALYSVQFKASDIDPTANIFTWTLAANTGKWLNLNSTTGWLNGTPTENDTGEFRVNVSVSDRGNGTDFRNFTLTVPQLPNTSPWINISKINISAVVDELYTVAFNGTDDYTAPSNLTWNLTTNATWLSINSNKGVLNGTPLESDVGWFWVNVSLDDGDGGISYYNFTINVTIIWIPLNTAPVLSNGTIAPTAGDTTTDFSFTVHYFDAEGDRPVSIEVVIDNASYEMLHVIGDPANGEYEFTTKLTSGEHTFFFSATDGCELVRTTNFTTANIQEVEQSAIVDDLMLIYIITLILILIVILVFIFLLLRYRKRKLDDELGYEEGDEEEIDREDFEIVGGAGSKENRGVKPGTVKARPKRPRKLPAELKIPERKRKKPEIIAPKAGTKIKIPQEEPILIKLDDSTICYVCLGVIKTGLPVLKCVCGSKYHKSCAERVNNCPNCDRNLLKPVSMIDDVEDEVEWQ